MKKRSLFALLLSLSLLLTLFAACGTAAAPAATEAPAAATEAPAAATEAPAAAAETAAESTIDVDAVDEITLHLAHGLAQESMTGQQYNSFCQFVEELSGGKMKIEQHVAGSLLSDTETLDAVSEGQIDFCHNMVSYASGTITDLALLEVPGYYVGSDWLTFAKAVQAPLEEIYAAYNIKFLGANYQGTTCFVNTKGQITKPADLKGLAFRTSGTWLGKAMEKWGAAATTIALPDLTTALERGTVDGTYVGWTIVGPFALYEVADYVTFTDISEGFAGLLMSMDTWNSLSPAQQAVITEAAAKYVQAAYDIGTAKRQVYYDTMEQYGTKLCTLTADEEKAFTDISLSLYDDIEPNLTDAGHQLLEVIRSFQ